MKINKSVYPLVTTIIPTYKRESSKVERAILSVINQTYTPIEIIVVDDNGDKNRFYSDQIKIMLNKYPEVIYKAYSQNKGACFARNVGINSANGSVIAFLDDDDTWEPTKIEKQISKIDDNNGFVYCGIIWHYENNGKTKYKKPKSFENPSEKLLMSNYIGSTSCGIVKKELAIQAGLFDVNLKSGQDLDFWYRLSLITHFSYVSECLVNYMVYTHGTITKNYTNRLESNIYFQKKYHQVFKSSLKLRMLYRLKISKAFFLNRKYLQGIIYLLTGKAKDYEN